MCAKNWDRKSQIRKLRIHILAPKVGTQFFVKAIVSSDGLAWKWYQWIDDKFLVFPEQIFF